MLNCLLTEEYIRNLMFAVLISTQKYGEVIQIGLGESKGFEKVHCYQQRIVRNVYTYERSLLTVSCNYGNSNQFHFNKESERERKKRQQ